MWITLSEGSWTSLLGSIRNKLSLTFIKLESLREDSESPAPFIVGFQPVGTKFTTLSEVQQHNKLEHSGDVSAYLQKVEDLILVADAAFLKSIYGSDIDTDSDAEEFEEDDWDEDIEDEEDALMTEFLNGEDGLTDEEGL